ncbi:MAG: cyclic lactone autoinducer peptide [Lachnospiraceae bacterium]|nr:cyclic lactone autoinducer peptide [Lachnospiraceae bacterium]MCM1231480.1 cyclic lactone autoinducer peptide [Ruminococcus flavefaciens]
MEILKLIAIIAELAAKAGAGSASMAGCHQPKEPTALLMAKKQSK